MSQKDGMPRDCAINFDHIQTVSKEKIGSYIASLSVEKLREVKEAVLFAIGL